MIKLLGMYVFISSRTGNPVVSEVKIIEGFTEFPLNIYQDNRGYFSELARISDLRSRFPKINMEKVQINHSFSVKGVIRGLHMSKLGQRKIVFCLQGEIRDCAVDLRPFSETFLSHKFIGLSGDSGKAVYIDEGLAHGFEVISESAILVYLVDSHYDQGAEININPLDSKLNIDWESNLKILSEKDSAAQSIGEYLDEINLFRILNSD